MKFRPITIRAAQMGVSVIEGGVPDAQDGLPGQNIVILHREHGETGKAFFRSMAAKIGSMVSPGWKLVKAEDRTHSLGSITLTLQRA